jgi:hypothetical protein
MFKYIGALPQPLKSFYFAYLIAFVVVFISFPLHLTEVLRWAVTIVGVVALLMGLCFVTNFRGSAHAHAAAAKEYRPMGVDYSNSFLATPAFARLFGAMAIFVGGGFVFAAITHPVAFGG